MRWFTLCGGVNIARHWRCQLTFGPTLVWILTNPFCVFAHKSRIVNWPIPLLFSFLSTNMGHQQRARLHSRTTPVSWYLRYIKTRLVLGAILTFLRRWIWDSRHYVMLFCVYHMPLLSQLQIKESVTEHRHPDHNKGCPGLAQPTWQSTTQGNSVCFQSEINKPVSAFLLHTDAWSWFGRPCKRRGARIVSNGRNNRERLLISNASVTGAIFL